MNNDATRLDISRRAQESAERWKKLEENEKKLRETLEELERIADELKGLTKKADATKNPSPP